MKNKYTYILLLLLLPFVAGAQGLSLTLENCKDMALQNDPYVRNAHLDVLAARAQKQEALAGYFPTVSLNAFGFWSMNPMIELEVKDVLGENELSDVLTSLIEEAGRQFGFSPVYTALKDGYVASVSAMQPLFAGGRIVAANRLASLGIEAAQLKQDIMLRDNDASVESGYWRVVSLEEKLGTVGVLAQLLDTLHKDLTSAVQAGLAVQTDLMQLELRQSELRSGLVQLKGGIRLAKMDLLNSIGQDYCLLPANADSLKPFIDDIVFTDRLDDLLPPEEYYVPEEELAAGVDEARLLDLSVEAKKVQKRIALGEALPTVGVGASYNYSHAINDKFNGTLFAMVKVPISDWGKVSRKVQRMDYQMQKASNERDYLSSQLLLQVRQLWLELTVAWDRMMVARETMDIAQKTTDQLMKSYEAGMIPLSELLQSQTMLRQAVEAYIDSQIGYSSALTAYRSRK